MVNRRDDTAQDLEALFNEASARPTTVPSHLMTRVLLDAQHMQPRQVQGRASMAGLWETWRLTLGGWAGMGGLATACFVGFWIGLSPPENLPDAGTSLLFGAHDDAVYETAEVTAFGWALD